MINAMIPLGSVKITLKDKECEIPTVVYFEQNNVQIAIGQIVSFEFALINGELRMVTRKFVDDKLVADVITVASITPNAEAKVTT